MSFQTKWPNNANDSTELIVSTLHRNVFMRQPEETCSSAKEAVRAAVLNVLLFSPFLLRFFQVSLFFVFAFFLVSVVFSISTGFYSTSIIVFQYFHCVLLTLVLFFLLMWGLIQSLLVLINLFSFLLFSLFFLFKFSCFFPIYVIFFNFHSILQTSIVFFSTCLFLFYLYCVYPVTIVFCSTCCFYFYFHFPCILFNFDCVFFYFIVLYLAYIAFSILVVSFSTYSVLIKLSLS